MADLLQDRVVAAVGDQYDLESELGRGGSAVVYRAMDVRLRRAIALKVLPPELAYREEVKSRFLREAQTSAQLSHPNIVPIYSVDERGGLVYFVMCLVEGESLAGRLRREPRPPIPFVRRVLREVADALAYAHARGVVHRDIKPDNILLDRESGRALVTDFGIARALEEGSRLTATGTAVGTPAYMSPEQAIGEREVDARSDIYSLGIVGYLMLAGQLPFRATNTPSMLMKHISEPPPPLEQFRPDVPPGLCAAIERALAKKPEERWADASHFRDAVMADDRTALAASAPRERTPVHGSAAAGDPFGTTAPANGTAPLPPFPPFPTRGDREARESWRREQRAWRERVRLQAGQGSAERPAHPAGRAPAAPPLPPVPALPPLPQQQKSLDELDSYGAKPLDERFDIFRRKLTSTAFTLSFLGFINLITFPLFPWVIFPAFRMIGSLRRRWESLRGAGVSWSDVWRGRLPVELGGRDPGSERRVAKQDATKKLRHAAWDDLPALAARVRSFRWWTFGTVLLPISGLIFGTMITEEAPMVLGFMSAWATGITAMVKGSRLRQLGLRVRDMLRPGWKEVLLRSDPRPREAVLASRAARLVSPEVLAGPHGAAVRQAVADRAEIEELFERMTPTDRLLLPDVSATVSALVERVAMLAGALHRLDQDDPGSMLRALESRLAVAEGEPSDSPDRERRMGLLQRQRSTLEDLVRRRATLAGQIESAALVLQTVRLDLVKLRSAGVQSALEDVTSATQEARALSRDIGNLLEAAEEVRAL